MLLHKRQFDEDVESDGSFKALRVPPFIAQNFSIYIPV